jgi:hypothetical protein
MGRLAAAFLGDAARPAGHIGLWTMVHQGGSDPR